MDYLTLVTTLLGVKFDEIFIMQCGDYGERRCKIDRMGLWEYRNSLTECQLANNELVGLLRGEYKIKRIEDNEKTFSEAKQDGEVLNMNKMAEVAKLFDKELGEKFTIIDNNGIIVDACFNEAGITCFPPMVSANVLKKLLTGVYRIKETPWKAKSNEIYFAPDPMSVEMYHKLQVTDNLDGMMYNRGLMCKTPEQAEELSKLLIKTARQFQGFDEECELGNEEY